MTDPKPDERQALIDAAHAAMARAKEICDKAEAVCEIARELRASQVREKATASRVLSRRGATRVLNDLKRASRDLEMLQARIESAKPPARTLRLRRRR